MQSIHIDFSMFPATSAGVPNVPIAYVANGAQPGQPAQFVQNSGAAQVNPFAIGPTPQNPFNATNPSSSNRKFLVAGKRRPR